jgi:hypothetical protein
MGLKLSLDRPEAEAAVTAIVESRGAAFTRIGFGGMPVPPQLGHG